MHVVFAAPECAPFVKTGGLGEVMGALPTAVAALGHRVTVFVPLYRTLRLWLQEQPDAQEPPVVLSSVTIPFAETNRFVRVLDGGQRSGVQLYLVDCPEFFDREGVYGPPGKNYPDNALRYGLYCRAVLEACKLLGVPDVFHVHDWQGAFVPLLLATTYATDPLLQDAATVFTVHNGGYQGLFAEAELRELLLPDSVLRDAGLVEQGKVNPFAAALRYADAITTVSPTYADELKTRAYGEGLDPLYRERAEVFSGILNGIDDALWNPATDTFLAAHYSSDALEGKKECRRDLLHAFGADGTPDSTAVIGIVSRIAAQKGFDLIAESMEALAQENILLLILGSGEPELQETFLALADRFPQKLRVNFEFEEALSHKVQAGSDLTLMPSRYEPSGLVQMYSLRYGTVPVVRATGGLCDSVQEDGDGDGFLFTEYRSEAMLAALRRALAEFQDKPQWQARMRRGMQRQMGWLGPSREYLAVYEKAIAEKAIAARRAG